MIYDTCFLIFVLGFLPDYLTSVTQTNDCKINEFAVYSNKTYFQVMETH